VQPALSAYTRISERFLAPLFQGFRSWTWELRDEKNKVHRKGTEERVALRRRMTSFVGQNLNPKVTSFVRQGE
jgi:hypothetical protein